MMGHGWENIILCHEGVHDYFNSYIDSTMPGLCSSCYASAILTLVRIISIEQMDNT